MEKVLRESLRGAPIEITVYGLLCADNVVRVLGSSDVMLLPHGHISTRRSSAIAGIACGLPVIAREGWETAPPITDAGVVLLPTTAKSEFGPALLRVLTDRAYRASLAERSRHAYQEHFSWEAIADKYVRAVRSGSCPSS
jgi:glycosyltransferase involved in cell wall biosynthesis